MSDMEDDFMCDDEEDYDLVFTPEITWFTFYISAVCSLAANRTG